MPDKELVMKRIVNIVLLICIVLALQSCSNSSDSGSITTNGKLKIESISQVLKDSSAFKFLKADVNDSVSAVGISAISNGSRAFELSDLNEYLFVKTTDSELNDVFAVSYSAISDYIDELGIKMTKGEEISTDKIPGFIDKLYVLGRYTLVSYLSVDVNMLLNAQQTSISGSLSNKIYQGNVSLRNGKDNHQLKYYFDDKNDFIHIEYMHNEDKVIEDVSFRTNNKCNIVSDESENVKEYDTYGYSNSYFRKSYLIDNNTGLIYSLDGLDLSVHHGIAYEKDLGPVALNVKGDDIEVIQLVQNQNIFIYDILKDKYNQYYILNDTLDETSTEDGVTVVYYTSNSEYLPLLTSGVMLHVEYGPSGDRSFLTDPIKDISMVGEGLIESEISYVGSIGKGGTVRSESEIPDCISEINRLNGQRYSKIRYGSDMTFSRIDEKILYGYGVDRSKRAEYAKIVLSTKDAVFTTYSSNNDDSFYYAPDESTLLVVSRVASEKNKYTMYSVYPYERDEYKQHYYDFVLHSNGTITQTPSYKEFKDKYYNAFRKQNCDKYTPAEFREKYQIDLEGTDDFVKGWYNIEGVSYDVEGVYADNIYQNATFYYVWKDGYSDQVFDDMYYKYVFVEDGVVKSDLTNHVLIENIDIRNIKWEDINFLNYDFPVTTSKGTYYYKVAFDEASGQYTSALADTIDAVRRKKVLQPIYR